MTLRSRISSELTAGETGLGCTRPTNKNANLKPSIEEVQSERGEGQHVSDTYHTS